MLFPRNGDSRVQAVLAHRVGLEDAHGGAGFLHEHAPAEGCGSCGSGSDVARGHQHSGKHYNRGEQITAHELGIGG